jgi:hypothetical protein
VHHERGTMKKIESKSGGLERQGAVRARSMLKRVRAITLSTRLLRQPGEETVHQQRSGRIPRAVAADAGFYSRENEKKGAGG